MSKKREIEQLISEAEDQGFHFDYLTSGHWKATNPKNHEIVFISSTPKSDRGVTNARVCLTRIGFTPKRPPKKKKRKVIKKMVLKIVETPKTDDEAQMSKLGEIATIRKALSTQEVKENIPMAAYVVWEAIHLRMKAQEVSKYDEHSKTLADIPGKVWEGNRVEIMRDLWPDISKTVRSRLGQYLTGSKNMAALVHGRGNMQSVWWISDEFNEVTDYAARYTKHNWWESPSPKDTQEDDTKRPKGTYKKGKYAHVKPDEDGYFRCDKCSFATKKFSSFQPHLGRLGDKPHPNDGTFMCNFCPDILPTAETLKQHHTRNHMDTGWRYCNYCVGYYKGDPYKHRANHAGLGSLDFEPEYTEEIAEAPHEVEISVKNVDESAVKNAVASIETLLSEYNSLLVENSELKTENDELRAENDELKAVVEPLRKLFDKK